MNVIYHLIIIVTLLSLPPSRDRCVKAELSLGLILILEGTGSQELHTYVNYAYGNEGPEAWYGPESWRQKKLKALKKKYDPKEKFSFYAPIA